MDRRRFLQLLGLGAGAAAIAPVIPFGRVWSFPKEIVIPRLHNDFTPVTWVTRESLEILQSHLAMHRFIYEHEEARRRFSDNFKVGGTLRVRIPQQFLVRDLVARAIERKQMGTIGDRIIEALYD